MLACGLVSRYMATICASMPDARSRLARRSNPELWANLATLTQFGFGSESGTGLMGESSGLLPVRRRWSDIERATLGFGYGLRVTPLQLASAYATLANKGVRNLFQSLRSMNLRLASRLSPERMQKR